ncbi:MAG: hypothetical protein HKO81_03980 [Flavobacteriaceae bacterium]|nr:hypothetical protein [Flavobacteriaceae bacterium]
MKLILSLSLLFFNLSISSQSKLLSGNYEKSIGSTDGVIIYDLFLKTDGTFIFHSYDKIYR